jgi:hypothetical protein
VLAVRGFASGGEVIDGTEFLNKVCELSFTQADMRFRGIMSRICGLAIENAKLSQKAAPLVYCVDGITSVSAVIVKTRSTARTVRMCARTAVSADRAVLDVAETLILYTLAAINSPFLVAVVMSLSVVGRAASTGRSRRRSKLTQRFRNSDSTD